MAKREDDDRSPPAEAAGAPRARRRGLRRALIAAQVLIGLGLGAVITEWVFSSRADGAFPHVNFYVADPELGVRLAPGATMRFQLRKNPLSTIHVNSDGYRGGEWPAPGEDEIIVVGDSQVFGLGVDDDATFSSILAQKTGKTVINAGVPTYGPAEYQAIAGELLARRKAKTVVVVLNFVNDPFEIDRPNRERHAVWDGWAVRSETAPAAVFEFPGRRWLFSQSHAVYAFRRWWHQREAGDAEAIDGQPSLDPVDLGTPSEGGWEELVATSKEQRAAVGERIAAADSRLAATRTRLGAIGGEIEAKRDDLDDLIQVKSDDFDNLSRLVARGNPGDIIDDERSEASRSIQLTAAMIRRAAQAHDRHLQELLEQEKEKGERVAHDLVAGEEALAAERERLQAELVGGPPIEPPPPSLFHDYLVGFKALAEAHGAELVVVALPIDVQVDPQEWAKYGVEGAPDMSESMILIDDLVADAGALGLRALDATAALRGAEPGAFLDHDIHMTAKGHAALGEALAGALAAPLVRPLQRPGPGLPERRTFAPDADAWSYKDEVRVKGSTAAGCSTQIRREWLRVNCFRTKARDRFDAVEVIEGGTPATMVTRTADSLNVLTPLTIGVDFTARFHWKGRSRELQIRWPAGEDGKPKFVGEFVDLPAEAAPAGAPAPIDPAVKSLCECHEEVVRERFCADPGDLDAFRDYESEANGCQVSCAGLFGDPALYPACEAAFPELKLERPVKSKATRDMQQEITEDHIDPRRAACRRRIACVQNDPLLAPPCPEGQVHAFTSNACFPLCDDAHPCAVGTCTEWQGAGVCV